MKLLIEWLILLTDNFVLLMLRQRQIEAMLKQLQKEVEALQQQRPGS